MALHRQQTELNAVGLALTARHRAPIRWILLYAFVDRPEWIASVLNGLTYPEVTSKLPDPQLSNKRIARWGMRHDPRFECIPDGLCSRVAGVRAGT